MAHALVHRHRGQHIGMACPVHADQATHDGIAQHARGSGDQQARPVGGARGRTLRAGKNVFGGEGHVAMLTSRRPRASGRRDVRGRCTGPARPGVTIPGRAGHGTGLRVAAVTHLGRHGSHTRQSHTTGPFL